MIPVSPTFEKMCVIVPSHISSALRIKGFCECLKSMLNQLTVVHVRVSISFTSELLQKVCIAALTKYNLMCNVHIDIHFQPEAMSQFEHIDYIYKHLPLNVKFVLFCDDDDSYHFARTQQFASAIDHNSDAVVYFETLDSEPKKHPDEYWKCCVPIHVLGTFLAQIEPNIKKHIFCDMVFVKYLQYLNGRYGVLSHNIYLYNYNRPNTSITGATKLHNEIMNTQIKTNQHDFDDFILGLNAHIVQNMDKFIQNMFLDAIDPHITFTMSLEEQLLENKKYIGYINPDIVHQLQTRFDETTKLRGMLELYTQM